MKFLSSSQLKRLALLLGRPCSRSILCEEVRAKRTKSAEQVKGSVENTFR